MDFANWSAREIKKNAMNDFETIHRAKHRLANFFVAHASQLSEASRADAVSILSDLGYGQLPEEQRALAQIKCLIRLVGHAEASAAERDLGRGLLSEVLKNAPVGSKIAYLTGECIGAVWIDADYAWRWAAEREIMSCVLAGAYWPSGHSDPTENSEARAIDRLRTAE